MKVLPRIEGLDQALILGQMRHDAHFNLRVISAHQVNIGPPRDKTSADTQAIGGTRWNVLQIRIRRGKTTRSSCGLRESGVNALVIPNAGVQAINHLVQLNPITVYQKMAQKFITSALKQIC